MSECFSILVFAKIFFFSFSELFAEFSPKFPAPVCRPFKIPDPDARTAAAANSVRWLAGRLRRGALAFAGGPLLGPRYIPPGWAGMAVAPARKGNISGAEGRFHGRQQGLKRTDVVDAGPPGRANTAYGPGDDRVRIMRDIFCRQQHSISQRLSSSIDRGHEHASVSAAIAWLLVRGSRRITPVPLTDSVTPTQLQKYGSLGLIFLARSAAG